MTLHVVLICIIIVNIHHCRHGSIVGYKEAFFEDSSSCLCIVMDYLDDGDLYQKIVKYQKANKMMGEEGIWRIFIEMCKALRALH